MKSMRMIARYTKMRFRNRVRKCGLFQFGDDSEFWVDQSSFYLFHVGWACYNNYGLGSSKEYRRHAQKIAEALANVSKICPLYVDHVFEEKFEILGRRTTICFLRRESAEDSLVECQQGLITTHTIFCCLPFRSLLKDAPLEWKKGMRFELMDPLAQMFNDLRVATVLEVLKVWLSLL